MLSATRSASLQSTGARIRSVPDCVTVTVLRRCPLDPIATGIGGFSILLLVTYSPARLRQGPNSLYTATHRSRYSTVLTLNSLQPRNSHDRLPRPLRMRHLRRRRKDQLSPPLAKRIRLLYDIHDLRLELFLRRAETRHRVVPYETPGMERGDGGFVVADPPDALDVGYCPYEQGGLEDRVGRRGVGGEEGDVCVALGMRGEPWVPGRFFGCQALDQLRWSGKRLGRQWERIEYPKGLTAPCAALPNHIGWQQHDRASRIVLLLHQSTTRGDAAEARRNNKTKSEIHVPAFRLR